MGALILKAVAKNEQQSVGSKANSLFDFSANRISGEHVRLADICKDKKCILVVNVATQWGLTKQNYTELVQLYAELESKGFQILAFPSNEFGGQEPGTNQ